MRLLLSPVLKPEIEHIRKILEKGRSNLQSQFDSWYHSLLGRGGQVLKQGGGGGGGVSVYAGGSGGAPPSVSSGFEAAVGTNSTPSLPAGAGRQERGL